LKTKTENFKTKPNNKNRFDLPVSVAGVPRLYLETGDEDTWLTYNQAKSKEREVAFTYTVATGHSSSGTNLTYVCTSSWCELDMVGGTASVMRY